MIDAGTHTIQKVGHVVIVSSVNAKFDHGNYWE